MEGQVNRVALVAAGLLVLGAVALLVVSLFGDEVFPEYSPSHRGQTVAVEAGCFSCHGGLGNPPSSNPGFDESRSVPDMFHERQSLDEIRQWIEDGITEEKRNSPDYMAVRESRVLQMPGYREQLSAPEIDDLVTYVALQQYAHQARTRDDVPAGEALARRLACFTCHGELGQGGVENPGSLKGYIPGFFGNDFRALTRNGDRQDLREWILDGRSQFFWEQGFAGFHPGRYFTERQAIRMPAYRGRVSDEEVETLVDYLIQLMELGPLDAEGLVHYRRPAAPAEPTRSSDRQFDPAPPNPSQVP